MLAESECDEWHTFAGDTIVCRAIAPRTVEQLSIWIEIQNNMQDILLPSNSIKCIHCLQNNCTQYHVKIIVCKKLWPNAMLYTNLPLHIAKLPQLQTTMHCIHRLQTNCDAPIINVLWWTTALKSVGSAISYHCAANPNSHCIWGGGGSCVGEKGPQRIKEFKRNCPTCPNCPTLSKCRTQSELISSKTKGKKGSTTEGSRGVLQVEGL